MLILFIVDIALRRINIGIRKKRERGRSTSKKAHIGHDKGEVEDQFTTDLLKARRDRRRI